MASVNYTSEEVRVAVDIASGDDGHLGRRVVDILSTIREEAEFMVNADWRIGQVVVFGRPNGEQTRGEIVKVNPKKLKIITTERRGKNGRSPVGSQWTVPKELCVLVGDA